MKSRRLLTFTSALLASIAGFALDAQAQQIDQQTLVQAQDRSAVINTILANLRVQLRQSPDPEGYSQRLSAALYEMNKDQLTKLTSYTNLADFEKAFGEVRNVANLVKLKAAAVDDSGYVFKPITPCGLVDTRFRNAAKPLIANVPEQFNIWNGVTQGSTSPCNAASIPTGEIGALAMTATVVGAVSDGWLIMSPTGDSSESSVLNYMPRDAIANSTVLKYTSGFTVKASTNAHVLVNLIGVFVKAAPKPLECYDAYSEPGAYWLPENYQGSMQVQAPGCNPGYTTVSISCGASNSISPGSAVVQSTSIETRICTFGSKGPFGAALSAVARCCRAQ